MFGRGAFLISRQPVHLMNIEMADSTSLADESSAGSDARGHAAPSTGRGRYDDAATSLDATPLKSANRLKQCTSDG